MSGMAVQKLYIDGRYADATSGETFETINPATGKVICSVQSASQADVDHAVASAIRGQKIWAAMAAEERARIMMRAAAILRQRNRELAELEVLDTGKPIREAETVDIVTGVECIEYFAGVSPSISGEYLNYGENFAYTRREPIGVCAGIGAWNYPIQIAMWKSAPALACGNAMVFKPSEVTPLSTPKLAEIYTEAGVPDGVFNVVQGDGRVGAMLTAHPDIGKVSLTGEASTGKKVMAGAASSLKEVTLELGGKSPLIIFDDTDVEIAVRAAMLANFLTQGEICANGTRVFVQRGLYEPFLEQLAVRTRGLRIGAPMDPETRVGALISSEHFEKVMAYIQAAKASGARLVCGGGRPADPALADGYFVEPTVFADSEDQMAHVREEIFGPVMSVLPFDTEDEVIARANATPYGLAAGVFTRDISRAHRVVARLQAGTCWINSYHDLPISMPFGGYKASGLGRENGKAVIDHYTQLKSVFVRTGDIADAFA
ncbi:betaine-aldehyde dehydrogenase [Hoeflea alexandrii]|uniref:betaine-aldehyde dehydrogenase n=1 Tax=Hoeflea alexandrii TaxID=288436 RepID=UPI0022B0757D|nr:betaine-aldehyde dehydrogenase [Hoeflea alexandrii]